MQITLSLLDYQRILATCKPALSRDTTRKRLTYIEMRHKDGKLTATALDGYIMTQTTCECSGDEGVFVMPPIPVGGRRKKDADVVIKAEEQQVTLSCNELSISIAMEQCEHVTWQGIAPESPPAFTIYFNAKLLRRVLQAAPSDFCRVKLSFYDPLKPVVIKGYRFSGLALPMRGPE